MIDDKASEAINIHVRVSRSKDLLNVPVNLPYSNKDWHFDNILSLGVPVAITTSDYRGMLL